MIEERIINTLRCLSVDMIEKSNSGHPGMPLGCAPMMFVLWCKIMNYRRIIVVSMFPLLQRGRVRSQI